MTFDLEIPQHLPAITLSETVFFPHVILPLHIFEDRYRQMVRDSLNRDRIFAVLTLDPHGHAFPDSEEPPHRIATAGIIRACQKNENGTSNLILQGLCRIRVESIIQDEPYRMIAIQPLLSNTTDNQGKIANLRSRLLNRLQVQRRLGGPITEEMLKFLNNVEESEMVVDMVAFSLCSDCEDKLRLLGMLGVEERLREMIRICEREIATLRIQRELQGDIDDDAIGLN